MAFTYFFRDLEVLELVIQYVLPDLKAHMYMNVWDAGCATGAEPYSLAILFRENMGRFLFRNVRIYATDIDEGDQFGQTICAGIYAEKDVQRIPAGFLEKYFRHLNGNGHFQVVEEIRAAVHYTKHNLLSFTPIRDGLGLVLCKNVLLHLAPAERAAVIQMFHSCLADGGYLVTEQTQKLPEGCAHLFDQITGAGTVFRKRCAAES